jgi:hypothetical protein
MNLLFIVTSFWAYGELLIAIEFARRAESYGYRALFLIPSSHEAIAKHEGMAYQILIPRGGKLNRLLLRDIEEVYRPDFVILADFLNFSFCDRHYGLCHDDLEVFSGKLGAFDLYDFKSTSGYSDTYGFRSKNFKDLSLESYSFLLQPCPVNKVLRQESSKSFRYSLFDPMDELTVDRWESARAELGVAKDEKIILMTTATWQETHKLYAEIQPFIKACNAAMEEIISNLPQSAKVVSIGSRTLFKEKDYKRFKHLDKILPKDFQKWVNACDLFVSNNYISTSMIKIVLLGVPTLLLSNSFIKRNGKKLCVGGIKRDEPELLRDISLAYPFRLFPVGWYKFLENIVNDNAFFSLPVREELFNIEGVNEKTRRILNDSTRDINSEKRMQYREAISTLPRINEILVELACI